MRSKSSLFYGFVVMAIGILLIVFNRRGELLSWVVILTGLALIVPCAYTLITAIADRRRARNDNADSVNLELYDTGMTITSVIGIAVGAWMVINPGFFIGFLAYAFAIILLAFGLYQVVTVALLAKPLQLSGGFYIIPVLLIVAGVVILCTSVRNIQYMVVLITGIGLVCAGFNTILGYTSGRSATKSLNAKK